MNFGPSRLVDDQLDKLFQTVLAGLKKKNVKVDELKKLVNSILPVHKYKLLQRFLSHNEHLSRRITIKCLPVFLDERTQFFRYPQNIAHQPTIKSILEIIPKYCPNIKTVDLSTLAIKRGNMECFKTFLKLTTSVKSLRVQCMARGCVLRQLLLKDEFSRLDQDVRIGLEKIEYINGSYSTAPECARLLHLLPNLKCLGPLQNMNILLSDYTQDENIVKTLSNFTDIGGFTTLTTLESFAKFCPNANSIFLFDPERGVVENLWKFPLLKELKLYSENPDLLIELMNLLKKIGRKIKILKLSMGVQDNLDHEMLHKLCPELIHLGINEYIHH